MPFNYAFPINIWFYLSVASLVVGFLFAVPVLVDGAKGHPVSTSKLAGLFGFVLLALALFAIYLVTSHRVFD